jgi:oligopeptidase B
MNTMCDPSIPLVTQEWEEWGNPNEKKYYEYMKDYSPYDNISKQKYPKIIVTTGLWDPRVQYWEPLKWVTKLKMTNPEIDIIMKTNMSAGHFSDTDRYAKLKEKAWEYATLLDKIS